MSVADCRARGGIQEERAERQRVHDEAESQRRRNFEWMQEMRRSGFRKVVPACLGTQCAAVVMRVPP